MSEFKAPEGWALVPVKPTQSMVNAAKEIDGRLSVWRWADGYTVMLNQAPKPPEDHVPDAGKMVDSEQELRDEIARLRFDLENATESRRLAQQALYDARERFQKEVLQRTAEVSRLLKERQDCEPDAWMDADGDLYATEPDKNWCQPHTPLYAAPPKREPLSVEEILQYPWDSSCNKRLSEALVDFARGVESKHGIGGQS